MTIRVMGQTFAVTSIQFTGTDSATVYYMDDQAPGNSVIRWIQMSLSEFRATINLFPGEM